MYLIFNGHFNFNFTRFGGKLFYDWNIHSKLLLVALWTNDDSVNVGWVAGERMLVTNFVLKKPGKVESISPTWGKSLRFLGHIAVPVIIIVILIASCFFLWHAWTGWIRNREAGKKHNKTEIETLSFFWQFNTITTCTHLFWVSGVPLETLLTLKPVSHTHSSVVQLTSRRSTRKYHYRHIGGVNFHFGNFFWWPSLDPQVVSEAKGCLRSNVCVLLH